MLELFANEPTVRHLDHELDKCIAKNVRGKRSKVDRDTFANRKPRPEKIPPSKDEVANLVRVFERIARALARPPGRCDGTSVIGATFPVDLRSPNLEFRP